MSSIHDQQTEDLRFRVLKLLQERPDISQRDLARQLGISQGKMNYCLKALMDKGLVKLENFQNSQHKFNYAYLLTPAGISEKAALTGRFLKRKMAEYEALQREVAELAGQIAGAFGRLDWVPFRYFNRAFSRQMLASIYRMASVALVTPLRDGMNLVAKEFVAAQDPDDPGVLILSQFAGAASELASGALLVNPYDEEAIAQAISRAVAMQPHERRQRHDAMMAVLRGNDVFTWCSSFLDRLATPRGAVSA